MLAVIETHPIQYHAPVYRAVQQLFGVPVTAIYGADFSIAGYRDREFQAEFAWDTDLVSGYTPVFLSRVRDGGAREAGAVGTAGLRAALGRLQPAAVMITGYSPRFHRVAWREARRLRRPLLFRGETSDDAIERGWLKHGVRSAALRVVYASCARLLYVGARSRAHFERLGVQPARLVFSPYCVDTAHFEGGEDDRSRLREQTRTELAVAPEQQLLLFSGKLSQRKGVDLIIAAIRSLKRDSETPLVVACLGDGEERAALQALADQDPRVPVRFLGFQNQTRLSRYYHAADLLVLPSRCGETWGLVVNEALHHGLPCVVSTRVGCQPDLVQPGLTGTVFEAESVPGLAAALQQGLALAGRRDVRDACRAKAARYSVEAAARGIATAYAAVVGAPEQVEAAAGG